MIELATKSSQGRYWYPVLYPEERDAEVSRIQRLLNETPGRVINWSEAALRENGRRIDSESRMLIMQAMVDLLDDRNLAAMLREWWNACDGAWRWGALRVVKWFRRAGLIDAGGFPWPSEPFLAWRGTMDDDPSAVRGLSWTLKRSKAYWFAHKDPVDLRVQDGFIWEADVTPGAILASFNHNGEHELVVDPSMIGELRLIRKVPSPISELDRVGLVRAGEKRRLEFADRLVPVVLPDDGTGKHDVPHQSGRGPSA